MNVEQNAVEEYRARNEKDERGDDERALAYKLNTVVQGKAFVLRAADYNVERSDYEPLLKGSQKHSDEIISLIA